MQICVEAKRNMATVIEGPRLEERSPMIEPGRTLLYNLTPRPKGTRWYHTHVAAAQILC